MAPAAEWTIQKLLSWATRYFGAHRIDSPRSTAEALLADALHRRRIDLYTHFDQPLNPSELGDFKALVRRRLKGEPVAYIVGLKGFWNLELEVGGEVLIPRPETERLVEAALDLLPAGEGDRPRRVLELGTGSGAVILSLASERPRHRYFASDRSGGALAVARRNTARNGLAGRVHFLAADWFRGLAPAGPAFDLIVSNPPYIAAEEIPRLQAEIRNYEPRCALDGGGDGLACIRRIVEGAFRFLSPGGHLLLEIGHDQRERVEALAKRAGQYETICFYKDYGGIDRVARLGRRDGGQGR